jgi:hypothetical protein
MFYGKGIRITVTFKLFNGSLELSYKEGEKSPYPVFKRSAKYVDGFVVNANTATQLRSIRVYVPMTTYL